MTVNDMDLVMQISTNHVGFNLDPSVVDRCLTFQHFNNHDLVVDIIAPHNSDARISGGDGWPPPLIFDVAYGCAVLKTWGVPAFIEFTQRQTRSIYYNHGDNNNKNDGDGGSHCGCGSHHGHWGDGQSSQQVQDCDAYAARGQSRSTGQETSNIPKYQDPDFADMVLGLWMQNARKVQHQAHAMKADRTQGKVKAWLESAE
jgi:hypothetical protein